MSESDQGLPVDPWYLIYVDSHHPVKKFGPHQLNWPFYLLHLKTTFRIQSLDCFHQQEDLNIQEDQDNMNSPLVQSPTGGIEGRQVQVDLGSMAGMLGRIKAAPVCVDATLKKEAMSTEDLSKLSFPLETPKASLCTIEYEPSVVSSASSTASRESAYLSDLDGSSSKILSTPMRLERHQSEQINLKVTNQKTSRNGRETQRWVTDPKTQRVYRMVTGCVPIVEGGRVLFVSSSRKADWILPKGGWEKDEGMEESAIRECFEEAGVLGILGPRLSEIEYETRKAKKRRKELEELQRKTKVLRNAHASSATSNRASEQTDGSTDAKAPADSVSDVQECAVPDAAQVSNEAMARIRGQAKPSDETCSVASDASHSHSHVRMALFPLYVSEVKSAWPESGRFRKAVEIDEAIQMCESRPELQAALKEVRARNLHHLPAEERGLNRVSDR